MFKEKETKEEVSLDNFGETEENEDIFADTEEVDLDDEGFTMFEDDEEEIDTTIPDGSLLDDDFDDEDKE